MASNSVSLVVLILSTVLNEIAGQTSPQGFSYSSYEVTIPRKLAPRYRQHEPWDVSYLLRIEGKGHVVHLRHTRAFFPKHFPIFTYSKEGDLQLDYPFIRDDCFYHGFVQGKASSLVTLSTCSGGLRGLFRLENETYEIEPVQASATFQHVVYRLEEKKGAVRLKCGLTEEEQSRQEAMVQNTENVVGKSVSGGTQWVHVRYAKVAVVVEHERHVQFDRNETLVAMQVLDVIHIANLLYEPLGVHVAMVGLEIWSEKNFIAITDEMESILDDFNLWRKDILAPRLKHDVGHLFLYKMFGTTLGAAFVGGVCNPESASAIESFTDTQLLSFAFTFTHELGHNLGMVHDTKYCTCDLSDCIMDKHRTQSYRFSNCSYISYYRLMTLGNTECLKIPPGHGQLYKVQYCGNRVVENGERCDCGSSFQCELDPCCQSNCTMHLGASCAFGQCCANCQYLPAGRICRNKTNICDLPEYCSGTSEWCPEDVYVQDGAPCSDGAYCYHGNCSTHNKQCKMIFGKKAIVASEGCFREVNTRGDRFGNCGISSDTHYKECKVGNILCGRIQCENVDKLPSFEEHSTIVQTSIDSKQCWGIDYHSGIGIADIGAVRDGAPCGTEMMCIDGQCMNVTLLKYDCKVTKCHNRGICNSKKHCHCDYGWAPPNCLNKGYGGSMDSGPPPPGKRNKNSTRIGIIIGIVFVVSAISFGAGLGIYYRPIH